jgi:hypothetical protein
VSETRGRERLVHAIPIALLVCASAAFAGAGAEVYASVEKHGGLVPWPGTCQDCSSAPLCRELVGACFCAGFAAALISVAIVLGRDGPRSRAIAIARGRRIPAALMLVGAWPMLGNWLGRAPLPWTYARPIMMGVAIAWLPAGIAVALLARLAPADAQRPSSPAIQPRGAK